MKSLRELRLNLLRAAQRRDDAVTAATWQEWDAALHAAGAYGLAATGRDALMAKLYALRTGRGGPGVGDEDTLSAAAELAPLYRPADLKRLQAEPDATKRRRIMDRLNATAEAAAAKKRARTAAAKREEEDRRAAAAKAAEAKREADAARHAKAEEAMIDIRKRLPGFVSMASEAIAVPVEAARAITERVDLNDDEKRVRKAIMEHGTGKAAAAVLGLSETKVSKLRCSIVQKYVAAGVPEKSVFNFRPSTFARMGGDGELSRGDDWRDDAADRDRTVKMYRRATPDQQRTMRGECPDIEEEAEDLSDRE